MNFLGHLLLTYPHRELTMGNLLGDLIRSQEVRSLSKEIHRGFILHHEIDRHTDSHPGVKELIKMMRPTHSKYAPVVVDILMDHVLARQWDLHAEVSYATFTQWVYDLIPDFLSQLSTPVVNRLESMVLHRWIDDYDKAEKLKHVLLRMDRRASFPSQFITGVEDIAQHYDHFAITFDDFYRDIKSKLEIQPEQKVVLH